MKTLGLLLFLALIGSVSATAQECYADRDCPVNWHCWDPHPEVPQPGFCQRNSSGACPGDCGCPGNNQCSCDPNGGYPGCVQLDGKIFQSNKPIPHGTRDMSLISMTMKLPTKEQLAELNHLLAAFWLKRSSMLVSIIK